MTNLPYRQANPNTSLFSQNLRWFDSANANHAYLEAQSFLKRGATKGYILRLDEACEQGSLEAIYNKALHIYKNEYNYAYNEQEVLKLLKFLLHQLHTYEGADFNIIPELNKEFPRLPHENFRLVNYYVDSQVAQPNKLNFHPYAQNQVNSALTSDTTSLLMSKLPRKFKSETHLAPVGQLQGESPVHCHTIREVTKINKADTSAIWIQKFPRSNSHGEEINIQIEAFASQVYRAMMLDNAPKNRVIYNQRGLIASVISKKIDQFVTLADFKPDNHSVDIASIARGVASAYVFEENDFRNVNCGFRITHGKKAEFIKIDHDQSFWSIVNQYRNQSESYAVPIDTSSLNNLLQLKAPTNHQRNWLDLSKIINTPEKLAEYRAGLYKYWLKSLVLDKNFFKAAVNAHISEPQLKKQILQHMTERRKHLLTSLFQLPEFRHYLLSNSQIIQEFDDEFAAYNKMITKEKDGADKASVFATQKRMTRLLLSGIQQELKAKYPALSKEQLNAYSDHIYQSFQILKHRQLAKDMTLNDYLAKLSPHLIHQICQNQPNSSEFQGQAIAKRLTEIVVVEHLTAELNKFSKRGLLQRLGDFFRGGWKKIKNLQQMVLSDNEPHVKLKAIQAYNDAPIAGHSLNEILKSSYKVIDVVESSSKACNGKTQIKTTAKETQGSHINLKQTNSSNHYPSPMTIRGIRNT